MEKYYLIYLDDDDCVAGQKVIECRDREHAEEELEGLSYEEVGSAVVVRGVRKTLTPYKTEVTKYKVV